MNKSRLFLGLTAALAFVPCAGLAETLVWYRFDGSDNVITNKANPGTMDATLKSINTWGSKGGLGNTSSMFPTRGDAFPSGTRLIDPASDAVYDDTVTDLSFTGDPTNSGTVFLDKPNWTDAFEEMTSFTCEVFFKLPTDSSAIETRRAKDILFPLVETASPDGGGLGWILALRKDSSSSGFYPFLRCKYNNGSKVVNPGDFQVSSQELNDGNWHHLAVTLSADASTSKATFRFILDYTTLSTTKTISNFTGFHTGNTGGFPLLVGADLWREYNKVKNCCFMGEIAEVRISDTVLSADELLRPLPVGPVDDDTLVYLPMGDCDWFGNANTSSYVNKYHGILNAAETATMTPYWFLNSSSYPYPVVTNDTIGASVRGSYASTESFSDTNSITFSRAIGTVEDAQQYFGHVIRVPYEDSGLADDSFTMEWFFKTDGKVASGNEINSYTFLNNSFAKIMINQANGLLLTRLINTSGELSDFNSSVRVDDAQWHHYALVYDKAQGVFSVYLDYTKIRSGEYTLTSGTTAPFCFGGVHRYAQVFSGQLDDFRITKRTLRASEFLTTREIVSDLPLFAHFDGDLSTGQDSALAPAGVGGTLGGGSAPSYVDHVMRIDLDGDGQKDYESSQAIAFDGSSIVWPHNSLLECRSFTAEWFAKYESFSSNTMLLRLGCESETGTGTMCWAFYAPGDVQFLQIGAHVSADGTWKDVYREDKNVATAAESFADGKWHHWALVAETTADAASTNTTFKVYRDYEQLGNTVVFANKDDAGGILALPSNGTTLSIGTADHRLNGKMDELRFTPSVLAPEAFMRRLPNGMSISIR